MAKALKLQLTVGQYDQLHEDKPGSGSTKRLQGEVFEARDQAEYDRLISFGAAVDPDKANAEEATRLRARLAELEAEQASTEAQIAAIETIPEVNPDDLKGKELDAALKDHKLPLDGTVEEKRARLAEALAPAPTWA